MRPLHPRQIDILDIARSEGRVEVDGLSDRFGVSVQTIRKDLNELCERRQLERVHGGAVYPSGLTNYAYAARRELASEGKRAIGELAASFIPDNASVILNIGTTTEMVARSLKRHQGLMAITNNINVANILRDAPGAEVVIAGGIVRHSDGGVVGAAAVDLIRQFRVDFAVIGASAIDEDGSLLDYDYREVRVAQAIIEQARHVILVADAMKFERRAPVRIGHLADMGSFVTDRDPPEHITAICKEAEVAVHVASPQAQSASFARDEAE